MRVFHTLAKSSVYNPLMENQQCIDFAALGENCQPSMHQNRVGEISVAQCEMEFSSKMANKGSFLRISLLKADISTHFARKIVQNGTFWPFQANYQANQSLLI